MTAAAASRSETAPGANEIVVEDVTYLTHGDKSYLARLYRPKGAGPFPMMIDLHGGAWCNQDRMGDASLCEAMARSGIVVAALDWRMPPDAAYPAALADINYGVRWIKANAAKWNGDAKRVGLVGISSGGHQAMLAAMRPADQRYAAIATTEVAGHDARVGCVVLCWPVIDAVGRYRYAKEWVARGGNPAQLATVIPSHESFWGDEATMIEGGPPQILERGERVEMPPVLYLQGDADLMHPRAQLDNFVKLYRAKGGQLDLAIYPGEESGFITREPKSPAHKVDGTAKIIDFVKRTLS